MDSIILQIFCQEGIGRICQYFCNTFYAVQFLQKAEYRGCNQSGGAGVDATLDNLIDFTYNKMMGCKIYIHDLALLCAAGVSPDEFRQKMVAGDNSGIVKVTACEKEFFAGRVSIPQNDKPRIYQLADVAVSQISQAISRIINEYGGERVMVCVGSCDNGSEQSIKAHRQYFSSGAFPNGYNSAVQGAGDIASYIASLCGATGGAFTFSTACSSSATAVVCASQLLQSGECDAVIAGGIDLASSTALLGFSSLGALSSTPLNPFSKNRNGTTLGEAAVLFIMTKEVAADLFHVELLGCGESCDAHHATSPDPAGIGASVSMQRALTAAAISPRAIDYVNLHGTGTRQNDASESLAMHTVFGEVQPLCSSTKAITGHTLGAAGALEVAATWLAMECGVLPLHKWDGESDPTLPPLNFVTKDNQSKNATIAMTNTFGFGGANVSVIIKKEQ